MNIGNDVSLKKAEPSLKSLRYFYFVSGVVATIAYRITFLLNPFWAMVAWYVGTIGFSIYFGHRTVVETKRARLVKENNLVEAVKQSDVPEDKKALLLYLTETSASSKVRFNSLFIFLASVFFLVLNIVISLWK